MCWKPYNILHTIVHTWEQISGGLKITATSDCIIIEKKKMLHPRGWESSLKKGRGLNKKLCKSGRHGIPREMLRCLRSRAAERRAGSVASLSGFKAPPFCTVSWYKRKCCFRGDGKAHSKNAVDSTKAVQVRTTWDSSENAEMSAQLATVRERCTAHDRAGCAGGCIILES